MNYEVAKQITATVVKWTQGNLGQVNCLLFFACPPTTYDPVFKCTSKGNVERELFINVFYL